MKFTIKFVSKKGTSIAIDRKEIGLFHVDVARIQNPQLIVEDLQSHIYTRNEDFVLPLSEEQARKSGLFLLTHTVTVYVPNGFLNQFAYDKFVSEENKFVVNVDQNEVFLMWERRGFPTNID